MKSLLLITCGLMQSIAAYNQGCVAIRNVASISPDLLLSDIRSGDKYILNFTNRYFEASSTYRGEKAITDTLVNNQLYSLNIAVLRLLKHGWAIGLSVPVSANSRTNSGDHGGPGTPKHTTHSYGLGDLRITIYKWLLNPATHNKFNMQAGLGLKFPTGDYQYEDYFYRNDTTKVMAPVDQAIQLGDGGTGLLGEVNAFYRFSPRVNLILMGFYLANPREQNGVSNLKGRAPTALEIKNSSHVMSVPDQWSVRAGINMTVQKMVFAANLRYEKVPVQDILGGSLGFRRAASIASVEPGLTYKLKNSLAYINLGIPLKRMTYPSVPDKITTDLTGINTITQAGFADLLWYAGVQIIL